MTDLAPVKVAITGHFRTGKDTLAQMLTELLPGRTTTLHFADALKGEVCWMTWVASGKPRPFRKFADEFRANRSLHGLAFQWWGEYRRQKFGEDYWINHDLFKHTYELCVDYKHNIIIADMRHHNEAQWARGQGFYLVRITGPQRTEGLVEARSLEHPSEKHISDLKVHDWIPNDRGLEHLRHQAVSLLNRCRSWMQLQEPVEVK